MLRERRCLIIHTLLPCHKVVTTEAVDVTSQMEVFLTLAILGMCSEPNLQGLSSAGQLQLPAVKVKVKASHTAGSTSPQLGQHRDVTPQLD